MQVQELITLLQDHVRIYPQAAEHTVAVTEDTSVFLVQDIWYDEAGGPNVYLQAELESESPRTMKIDRDAFEDRMTDVPTHTHGIKIVPGAKTTFDMLGNDLAVRGATVIFKNAYLLQRAFSEKPAKKEDSNGPS